MSLTVKLPYALALAARFPTVLREPLGASVTIWEATAPVKLPTCHCPENRSGPRLGLNLAKGGIPRLAPPRPEPRLLSLPPILCMVRPNPMASYSKASWGLSVLPQVKGIFTPSATSLSPSSRQWGSRYAIRAGRNLPDKEFRYLRTVIVTAAVYRGFGSKLRIAADFSP